MDELWYHGGGCRAWLKVSRNTLTHEIFSVERAGAGAAKAGAMVRRPALPSPYPLPERTGRAGVGVATAPPPSLRGEDAGSR